MLVGVGYCLLEADAGPLLNRQWMVGRLKLNCRPQPRFPRVYMALEVFGFRISRKPVGEPAEHPSKTRALGVVDCREIPFEVVAAERRPDSKFHAAFATGKGKLQNAANEICFVAPNARITRQLEISSTFLVACIEPDRRRLHGERRQIGVNLSAGSTPPFRQRMIVRHPDSRRLAHCPG